VQGQVAMRGNHNHHFADPKGMLLTQTYDGFVPPVLIFGVSSSAMFQVGAKQQTSSVRNKEEEKQPAEHADLLLNAPANGSVFFLVSIRAQKPHLLFRCDQIG
jgi:hypothetical protein